MPKRENRGLSEAVAPSIVIQAEEEELTAGVADESVPAAAPVYVAAVPPPAAVAPPVPPPAAAVAPAASSAQEELLKAVMEQQRQQILALTSMVRDLQNKVTTGTFVQPAQVEAAPPAPVAAAAPPAPSPVRAARPPVNVRNARRRVPSSASSAAASAFVASVPQLPNQAALGGGDDERAAPRARRQAPSSRQAAEADKTLSGTYRLRRETRGAAGRRVWDHKSNTPRSQAEAGAMAARDEIRAGSSYLVRGFSGMV